MTLVSSLHKKIFIGMILTGLVPVIILSFQNHYFGREVIEKLEKEHLSYALKSKMLWLREWLRHSKKEFYRISVKVSVKDGRLTPENMEIIHNATENLFKGHASYKSLTIYNHNWLPIYQYPEENRTIRPPSAEFKEKFSTNTLFTSDQPYIDIKNQVTILPIGQSIIDRSGLIRGFIIAELNISRSLNRILGDTSDLDETSQLSLVTSDGKILFTSPSSYPEKSLTDFPTISSPILQEPFWQLKKSSNSTGDSVIHIAAFIPEMNWVLVIGLEKIYLLKEFQQFTFYGELTALFILCIILLIARQSSKIASTPLTELAKVSQHISKGNFQERLPEFKEPHLNEVSSSFNTMLDTLEKNKKDVIQTISLSAVGKLSSSIVHEMRNPLSSIKINLQALARKVKADPAYAEMASISLMQVARLESMFTELLNFSKPIHLTPENLSFKQLIDEVLELLTPKNDDKSISIEVIDNLTNVVIQVDKKNFVLALSNLIDNAIQWSTVNSVVQVKADKLPAEEGFKITVVDSGPGLREDQMAKLFQPFYTTREQGTGLGLANVKKIVEFHGGTVSADNNPNGGAQFSMIFNKRFT